MTSKLSNVVGINEQISDLIARAQRNAPTPEQFAREAQREALQRRERNLCLARPAIKPHAVRSIVADTLDDTGPLRAVKRWLGGSWRSGDGTILVLSGGKGCGKDVAASWALAKFGGAFVPAFELASISTDFQREEWNRLGDAQILVLSDVGDEGQPQNFGPAWKHMLDRRCGHLGKMIVTTNHGLDFLKDRYVDGRLWSRMHESAEFANVDGPDLRRAKK